jgi:hypothetical protein
VNGHRSASGTRARHITCELHQIWMGNDSISDVDREVIGRIARASLRHEEKAPGTVVSRVRLRGGGQGNKRNCGCHVEQRFLHHYISDCADIGVLTAPKDAKALRGANFRGFCISSSCAIAAERFSCGNDVTLPRDAAISEAGFGPAWIMPSCRIEISEKREAAARWSRSRSFGCKPSPRAAANALNDLKRSFLWTPPVSCPDVFQLEQSTAWPLRPFEWTWRAISGQGHACSAPRAGSCHGCPRRGCERGWRSRRLTQRCFEQSLTMRSCL